MKALTIISSVIWSSLPLVAGAATAAVDWTDTGGVTIQASFVAMEADAVVILKNGVEFTVPMSRLSPGSAELARKMAEPSSATGEPGRKILAFCRQNLGKKVGDGQCSTLAAKALEFSHSAGQGRDSPGRGDYVWGKEIALIETGRRVVIGLEDLSLVKPGDIIQFRDARFEGVNRNGGGTYWMSAPHHTAVVAAVNAEDPAIMVYHQNWGKKIVGKDTFHPTDLKSGWLRIYRPVATK